MARQLTSAKTPRTLNRQEKIAAVTRLEARIAELRALEVGSLRKGDDPAVTNLDGRIRSTLAGIYGENSLEYERPQAAADLDATSYSYTTETPTHEIQ